MEVNGVMLQMGRSKILFDAIREGRAYLTEIEAKNLLREAGVDSTESRLAKSKDEAISVSREIGFPVVLKVVSPQIIHKSDVLGVKLGLKSEEDVGIAYDDILTSVKRKERQAVIEGVAVQKMARPGLEVIIGVFKDPQFGPVIMFGLGGVLVEILRDVSFRIVPITKRDANQMIREIKGYPLLHGYRGQEPANIPLLERLLLKVSQFADQNPEIKEMDLNPIFIYSDSAIAVDARIVLETNPKKEVHSLKGDIRYK